MNDKKLKDMWTQAQNYLGNPGYERTAIEKFISNSSSSVTDKILKILKHDIITKLVIMLILVVDIVLYYQVQTAVANACSIALVFLLLLILYEYNVFKQFIKLTDNRQSAKEILTGMHTFLRNRSFPTLLSISSSYLFGFSGALLLYFFAEYGELRRMGSIDFLVFPTICLIGIIFNYIYNNNIIKFQKKHLELCLSDLDEEILPIVSHDIEKQQKKEKIISILIVVIVFLSFLLLVAVLKRLGF